jgi:FkbM family methyltransferase
VLASRLRTAIDRNSALRRIAKSRAGQQLIKTARGSCAVREPLRFAAHQLGPPCEAAYRVRGCETRVLLRHRTRDIDIFNEIFGGTGGRHSYDPPATVRCLLEAAARPRVLDVGANIGLFGAYVLGRWPRALIRSYEPDPTNLRLLHDTIAANGLESQWSASGVAVANAAGEMQFESGLFADSRLVLASARARPAVLGSAEALVPVPAATRAAAPAQAATIAVRAVDFFGEDHDVELLKMDIEGGEWAILGDARLAGLRARAIVLEWHAAGCPQPDARAHALARLRAAGYTGLYEVERGRENGLLWAWRESSPVTRASASP